MKHVDILIIGAGLSGIGAGCHLSMKCPDRTFAILERREAIGGTWDLFRYPGIRSDSDMYTFGYSFRPWTEGCDIAPGQVILRYLNETLDDYHLREKIWFSQQVTRLDWSCEHQYWTVTITDLKTGESWQIRSDFLINCTGYYSYEAPYQPDFPGQETFQGPLIHPQFWPEDLNYRHKRVIVIGSGATAVTLVPAIADGGAKVTLVQRSPTYIFSRPATDPLAASLRHWLPSRLAWRLMRLKQLFLSAYFYALCRRQPEKIRAFLRRTAKEHLGPSVDVDTHFKPRYNPWDQRLCLIPDGDLFRVLREGSARIVTEQIERLTEKGLKLHSGEEIDADIIVTATGLSIELLGGMDAFKDGEKVDIPQLVSYRGTMFGNIPNFFTIFGYPNASWTLRADLSCQYICRLLNFMKKHRYKTATPILQGESLKLEPLLGLTSGYLQRAAHKMPRRGTAPPWCHYEYYFQDYLSLRWARLNDGVLSFR